MGSPIQTECQTSRTPGGCACFDFLVLNCCGSVAVSSFICGSRMAPDSLPLMSLHHQTQVPHACTAHWQGTEAFPRCAFAMCMHEGHRKSTDGRLAVDSAVVGFAPAIPLTFCESALGSTAIPFFCKFNSRNCTGPNRRAHWANSALTCGRRRPSAAGGGAHSGCPVGSVGIQNSKWNSAETN